jgi:hypothetical protein
VKHLTKRVKTIQREYQAQYRYHMANCGHMTSDECKASADQLRLLRCKFQVEIEAAKFGQEVL